MKRKISIATIVIVSLNLSCLVLSSNLILEASAQEAEAETGTRTGETPVRDSLTQAPNADPLDIYREAGINKEQEDKIRKMAKEFEDVQRVRLKQLFGLLEDMQELQLKPDPSEPEVMAKQTQINTLRSDISNSRIKLLLEIRATMQPEQKEKLVSLVKERKARARKNRAN